MTSNVDDDEGNHDYRDPDSQGTIELQDLGLKLGGNGQE